MIKKFIWMVVLLAITAFTVFIGEGFDFPFIDPTPTAIICENCTIEPTQLVDQTATPVPTEIIDPTSTEVVIDTPEMTATPEATLTPSATTTLTSIPPTVTSTATKIPPTATNTVTPVLPTATNTPAKTATSTATPASIVDLFSVQKGSPVLMTNFVHTAEGCAWQGVAGQLFNKSGVPLVNYIVKISGTYKGTPYSNIGITGMVSGNPYGPGSFEIVLGNTALDSEKLLTIQLFNPQGAAITNPLAFSTYAACTKNLTVINFTQK